MTTLISAASLYRFYNKCDVDNHPTTQFYLIRTLDIICSIERLCYKIGRAVLLKPGEKTLKITLKNKQRDWLIYKRIFQTALRALKLKYGNVDLSIDKLSLTIFWNNTKLPVLNIQDHLNSKLFQAILSNRLNEVVNLVHKGADPNAIGPFGKRPLHAVLTNPPIVALLLRKGADPACEDDQKLSPIDLITMRSGHGTEEEYLIHDYIEKKIH